MHSGSEEPASRPEMGMTETFVIVQPSQRTRARGILIYPVE